MTFCLGMKTHDGLVALADTRLTSGTQTDSAKKVTLHDHGDRRVFVMTSGLRSVRDKVLTYLDEELQGGSHHFDRLYQVVNLLATQLRRVYVEDGEALQRGGLRIDLNALVGGEMSRDGQHRLYWIYPEGNWVEVTQTSPYFIIGESGYGKPVLDRTLRYEDDMKKALKVGMLAFDATRTSASDVGYPIDVVTYRAVDKKIVEHRFTRQEVEPLSDWWNTQIRQLVATVPNDIVDTLCHHALGEPPARGA